MIARLFAVAGIDFPQWKALTRAVLKMDLRVTGIGRSAFGSQQRNQRIGGIIGLLFFYAMMGGVASTLIFVIKDVMLSTTLVLTYLMFMVGTMVLLDNQSVITSPDDFPVLGHRPVNSRTYFAVRVTNVLVYTLSLTLAFGCIPLGAIAIRFGPVAGVAAFLAFVGSTMLTSLGLIAVYAWMLRIAGPDRIKRVLSYVQLVMGFMVYGGYFLIAQVLNRSVLGTWSLPSTPLAFLYPATWFASYVAIATGSGDRVHWILAGVSVLAIVALIVPLAGRLSLAYAEELGALATATAARVSTSASRRRPWWFRGGENRAIAILIRAQFRNDQRFRIGVLGVLPLTILYMLMSLKNGPLPDPFTMNLKRLGDTALISLAVFMFPSTLRLNLTRSDSFRASWIYFTSPTDRAAIVAAMRNVIVVFFLLPYLAVVAAAFTYFTRQPIHILTHVLFLGLMSHILLQVNLLAIPELPFSLPPQKATRSGLMMAVMFGSMILAFGALPILSVFIYVSIVRIALALAALIAVCVALDRLTRVRVDRLAEELEFGG